ADRARDEIVDHQVEPEAIAHAAGGGEAQAGDGEVPVGELREVDLGADLRLGIGGERVQGRGFAPRRVVRQPVDAAARGEHEALDARRFGHARDLDAGAMVDLVGDLLERLPHRIVGDGGKVDDRVHAAQQLEGESAHVGEMLNVGAALGKDVGVGQAVGEIALVQADQRRLRVRLPEPPHYGGSDVAAVAGNKYFHFLSSPL